jgi:hypothetical protein
MDGLRIDLHLDPEPNPLQPDLAAVGGPLHALDQGAEPTRHFVDSGLQTCASVIERMPMLHRERHQGHDLPLLCHACDLLLCMLTHTSSVTFPYTRLVITLRPSQR